MIPGWLIAIIVGIILILIPEPATTIFGVMIVMGAMVSMGVKPSKV